MKQLKGFLDDDNQRREEWQAVKEAVKRAEPCTNYIKKAPKGNYICPFCGSGTGPDKSGALEYYRESNKVSCFANCKEPGQKAKSYDVIDLYKVTHEVDTATAIKELAQLHNIPLPGEAQNGPKRAAAASVREKHEPTKKTPEKAQNKAQKAKTDYSEYFKECAARLGDPAALAYLESRGISRETAERFGLGFDPEADPASKPGAAQGEWKPHPAPRIITPQGKYCFVGRRTDGVKGFEKMNADGGKAGLTYEEEALEGGAPIFVTEGAFDALSIMEASPVYAIALNSTSNAGVFIQMLEQLPEPPKWEETGEPVPFIICMDPDKGGQEVEPYLLSELQRLGVPCIASHLEGLPGEDPNDILVKYGKEEMKRRVEAAATAAMNAAEDPDPEEEEIINPFALPDEEEPDNSTPSASSSKIDPSAFTMTEEEIDAMLAQQEDEYKEYLKTPEGQAELAETEAFWSGLAVDQNAKQAKKTAETEEGTAEQAKPEEPPKDPIEAFLEEINSRRFEPISTGIKDIDRALQGGFLRRTLITLAAAPGSGKTALACWLFEKMAASGYDVLYLNLEMDRAQLLARSISRIAWRLSGKRSGGGFSALDVLRAYEWTPEQHNYFLSALEEYKARIAPHFVYNPDTLEGSNDIKRILAVMQEEVNRVKAAGRPEPLICVDYLQIIAADASTTAEGIQVIIKALKDFAIQNNTVVFLITAQNRASNKSGVSEMESGRDTSAIEYTGDVMLGLVYTAIEDGWTWTYYERDENGNIQTDKDGRPKKKIKTYDLDRIRELQRKAYEEGTDPDPVCNKLTLKVLKNRFGAAERRANLIFDGEHGTFHQVEREGRPDPDPDQQDKRGEWQQGTFPDASKDTSSKRVRY